MNYLTFTGQQTTADFDILLGASLNGTSIGVRVTREALTDKGLAAAQDKAVEKAKLGKFEPDGGLRVTTADFR